jgi:DNA polymerase I
MTVLIDGDIQVYRAAYSTEGLTHEDAEEKVDELLEYILQDTTFDGQPYEVFLTGSGNFRYDIAKTEPYKGNRKDGTKPEFFYHIREYLVEHWDAVVSEGEEADDLIAIRATELGGHAVIASVDKDFLQVPCTHYNTRTREFKTVSEWEGLKFFYHQILTGDRSDNIPGLHRVGPKTAYKMLQECNTELDMFRVCVDAYEGPDRVLENARLLWLRRKEGQLWVAPTE